MHKILIFDLDGVLVNSKGYIKAFQAAVHFLCSKGGLDHIVPGNEAHAIFESIGISSEWDMTALYFALALEIAFERCQPAGWDSLRTLFDHPRNSVKLPLMKSNLEFLVSKAG